MHGGDVGGGEGVGEDGGVDARLGDGLHDVCACARGHEIGADEIEFALGRAEGFLDFVPHVYAHFAV